MGVEQMLLDRRKPIFVGIEVIAAGLDQPETRLDQHWAHASAKKAPRRQIVYIEDGHELACGLCEAGCQCACFETGAQRSVKQDRIDPPLPQPRDRIGRHRDALVRTVVEHLNVELVAWPVELTNSSGNAAD